MKNNKQNTLDVLNVTLNVLSGNIAGGALLANGLYKVEIYEDHYGI